MLGARFVAVSGKLQNEQGVIHIIADRMDELTSMLGLLSEAGAKSRQGRALTKSAARS